MVPPTDETKPAPIASPPAPNPVRRFFNGLFKTLRLPHRDIDRIIRLTFSSWNRHRAPRLGAALAYYTILSMTPLIFIALKIAASVYGDQAATGQLSYQLQDLVGEQMATVLEDVVRSASKASVVPSIFGAVALFFGATTVVSELRDALNTIWEVAPREGAGTWNTILTLFRDRGFSFLLVMGTGLLLLLSLAVNTWLSALGHFFGSLLPWPEFALQTLDWMISFIVITFLFALLFKVLPDVPVQWSDVAVGSIVTALLFSLGKLVLALYLGKSTVGSAFGAAGSLVAFLVWVYYSAQIFFFGAEFTQVYANEYGSKPCDRYAKLQWIQKTL